MLASCNVELAASRTYFFLNPNPQPLKNVPLIYLFITIAIKGKQQWPQSTPIGAGSPGKVFFMLIRHASVLQCGIGGFPHIFFLNPNPQPLKKVPLIYLFIYNYSYKGKKEMAPEHAHRCGKPWRGVFYASWAW